jgi:hypothetical protein
VRSAGGDGDSGERAEEGEDENFSEQLGDDGAARSSQGEADGDFVLAASGAGEQERGDVGASDEEQERDGAVEHPERTAGVADDGGFEGGAYDDEIGVGVGKLLAEAALHGGEIRLALM